MKPALVMRNDELTQRIIGCCFAVHRELGPGFPEKIYHVALEKSFGKEQIPYTSEQSFRVAFQGEPVGLFKADLVVQGRVVIEVKAVTGVLPKVFESQVIAYLKATQLPVGLLVNFGNGSCQVRRLVHESL